MSRATMLPEPEITTARLVLRAYRLADVDRLVAGVADFAVSRMLAKVPHPYGRADGEAFVSSLAGNRGADLMLAITEDDALIGGIGLSGLRSAREFGYWLGRDHWGKGYATEAARAVLAFAFDEAGVGFVRSGVFADNPASLKVQRKLGFLEIGRRQVHSLARGEKVDHIDTILTAAALVR